MMCLSHAAAMICGWASTPSILRVAAMARILQVSYSGDYSLSGPNGTFTLTPTPGSPDFPVSLKPWGNLPSVGIRDIVIAPGARDYYSQFFDVSKLRRYPDELLNPRTQLTSAGVEHKF